MSLAQLPPAVVLSLFFCHLQIDNEDWKIEPLGLQNRIDNNHQNQTLTWSIEPGTTKIEAGLHVSPDWGLIARAD